MRLCFRHIQAYHWRLVLASIIITLAGCDTSSTTGQSVRFLNATQCDSDLPAITGQECGQLVVAENPDDADGSTLELNILRLPAVSASPAEDPLFIIAGGPGQSAVSLANGVAGYFAAVRKQRDIVFIDQRGTGQSAPLECEGADDVSPQLSSEQQREAMLKILAKCAETHAARAVWYSTPYAINDIESVRVALNYPRINVWGVSYGTRVALAYLQRFPESVRTLVIDGVAPASMHLLDSMAQDVRGALTTVIKQCADNQACTQRYGDVQADYDAAMALLAEQPRDVIISHPLTQLPETVRTDDETLDTLVRMALYSRDTSRLIPFVLHSAKTEDFVPAASLLMMFSSQQKNTIAYGMHLTVLCNEDYPGSETASGNISSPQGLFFNKVCQFWSTSIIPADYKQPVTSDKPVLILSGGRDPVTPVRWGDAVQQHLSNSLHLIAPGGHHSITRDGCVPNLIAQFITRASTQLSGANCVEDIKAFDPYLTVLPEAFSADADIAEAAVEAQP